MLYAAIAIFHARLPIMAYEYCWQLFHDRIDSNENCQSISFTGKPLCLIKGNLQHLYCKHAAGKYARHSAKIANRSKSAPFNAYEPFCD